MKQVTVLNRNNEKDYLKVVEDQEVYYLVVNNKTGKEVKFDYFDNESAIEEFWKPSVEEVEEEKEFKNNTKMKVPFKYQHMLAEIDNEGKGSGIWAYSKEGYQFGVTGSHTLHEYNQKDLMAGIRTLQECECNECKKVR